MHEISFEARGQQLSRTGPGGRPQAGSRGHLLCRFGLDGEWEGLRVAARFFDGSGRESAEWLEGGACPVPDAVTGGRFWRVSLVGVGEGVTLTTNRCTVFQEVR